MDVLRITPPSQSTPAGGMPLEHDPALRITFMSPGSRYETPWHIVRQAHHVVTHSTVS